MVREEGTSAQASAEEPPFPMAVGKVRIKCHVLANMVPGKKSLRLAVTLKWDPSL